MLSNEYGERASKTLLEEVVGDVLDMVYSRANAKSLSDALSDALDRLESPLLKDHKTHCECKKVEDLDTIISKYSALLEIDKPSFRKFIQEINGLSSSNGRLLEICGLQSLLYRSSRRSSFRTSNLPLEKKAVELKEIDRLKIELQDKSNEVERLQKENAELHYKLNDREANANLAKAELSIQTPGLKNEVELDDILLTPKTSRAPLVSAGEEVELAKQDLMKARESLKEIQASSDELRRERDKALKDLAQAQALSSEASEALRRAESTIAVKDKALEGLRKFNCEKDDGSSIVSLQKNQALEPLTKKSRNPELVTALMLSTYAVGALLTDLLPNCRLGVMYVLPLCIFSTGSYVGERKELKTDMMMIITFATSAAQLYLTKDKSSAVVCSVALVVGVGNWIARVQTEDVQKSLST